MVINKRIALALVFTNISFLIYSIFLFFYFHNTILPDFNRPESSEPASDPVWYIFVVFLNVAVYIGLFWVLGAFKEHFLIRGAMLLLVFLKIPALICLNWTPLDSIAMRAFFQSFAMLFGFLVGAMMLVLLLVRNKMIRVYFRGLVGLMFVAVILPLIGAYAYDNFGIRWLLIDRFLLVWLSFIPTLLLFIKVYRFSKEGELKVQE